MTLTVNRTRPQCRTDSFQVELRKLATDESLARKQFLDPLSRGLDRITRLVDDEPMRVTFLGTGTSHGIPMIGCDCAVCRSDNPHNHRLRPSIYIENGNQRLLVDATPDFRAQALRANIRQVDAVLMTHTHADHVMGLDDLRVFCQRTGRKNADLRFAAFRRDNPADVRVCLHGITGLPRVAEL